MQMAKQITPAFQSSGSATETNPMSKIQVKLPEKPILEPYLWSLNFEKNYSALQSKQAVSGYL